MYVKTSCAAAVDFAFLSNISKFRSDDQMIFILFQVAKNWLKQYFQSQHSTGMGHAIE